MATIPTHLLHVQREQGADTDLLPGLEPGVPAAEAGWRRQPLGDSSEASGGEKPGRDPEGMGPPGKLVKRWDTQIDPAVLGDLAFTHGRMTSTPRQVILGQKARRDGALDAPLGIRERNPCADWD